MFETERLHLRLWTETDVASFIQMNQDPRVMRFFPGLYPETRSRQLITKFMNHYQEHGFTIWALERKDSGDFIGFTGTVWIPHNLPFTPAVEIAWRLAAEHWRQGLAAEAARKSLELAFEQFAIDEVVAMTARLNMPSIHLMKKLNMTNDSTEDFEHPNVPEEHALRPHVVYRMKAENWTNSRHSLMPKREERT